MDDFSTRFHQLPSTPVAIIELDDWSLTQKIKVRVRKVLNTLSKNRFGTLETYCQQHGLAHYPIARHQKHLIAEALAQANADLVITYRCPIVPTQYLSAARYGGINLHASLLPNFRGGDPLFWQVLHGVEQTGITVHQLTDRMDAGPILRQVKVDRPKLVSEKELWNLLNIELGYEAICSTIKELQTQTLVKVPQDQSIDSTPAPNGARQRWKELAEQLNLSDEAFRDLSCFMGEPDAQRIG